LVTVALADFSAAALAAVATSQAFWEASSSASRDAIQALVIDKASAAGKREKESRIKNQRKTNKIGRRHNLAKTLTLRSSSSFQELDTFSTQRDEFLHQNLSKGRHEQESSSNK
jgi:hypothetical protein